MADRKETMPKTIDPKLNWLRKRFTGPLLQATLVRAGTNKYRIAQQTGIAYQTLHDWQRGHSVPSDDAILKVGKALGIIK